MNFIMNFYIGFINILMIVFASMLICDIDLYFDFL